MFSHDSPAFKLMCVSLYGRAWVNNDKELPEVIDAIKARRKFIKTFSGGSEIYRKLSEAYGFIDERELMGDDE